MVSCRLSVSLLLIALCFAQAPSQGGWLLDGLGRPVDAQSNPIPPIFFRLANELQRYLGLNWNDAVAVANLVMEIDRLRTSWDGQLAGNDPKSISEPFIIDLLANRTGLNRHQAGKVILLLKSEGLDGRLGL